MNKNVLEHHNIMVQISKFIENSFCQKVQLPDSLVNDIIARDDHREWQWFFQCFERTLGRFVTSGCSPKVMIPLAMQKAIILRAKNGWTNEIERYIKLMPFDECLHLQFWTACRKKHRYIIDDYISRYPLVDDVLDRYWQNSNDEQKKLYLIHNHITRDMAGKMWCANPNKTPKKWARFYLKHHPVPDGVVEDLYNDLPYVVDIWDLIEFSTQPFGNHDEVVVVERLKGEDAFPYIDKFGLKKDAQLAMLRTKNDKLIRHYIKGGWSFDPEAQRYMLDPEFLKDGGKELLAHYLMVEPEPFDMKLEERIRVIFG